MPVSIRNFLLQTALALGTFLALFALCEVALRVINFRTPLYELEMLRYALELKIPMESSYATHRHRPNTRVRLMNVDFNLNELGYRAKPLNRKGVRILVLGDSNTVGWGVPYEKVFTTLLEERINKERPFPTSFEVLNAGVGNYPVLSQYGLFLSDRKILKPDLVVVQFSPIDARRVIRRKKTLLSYSYALAFLNSKWATLQFRFKNAASFEKALLADFKENIKASLTVLVEMGNQAKQEGLSLVVMIRPEIQNLSPQSELEACYQQVEAELKNANIPVLNLIPAFRERFLGKERELWLSENDYHFNEVAHAFMAELFHDYLVFKDPMALKPVARTTGKKSRALLREVGNVKEDRP